MRRPPVELLVPTALAALVRTVHLVWLAGSDPLFRVPVVDSAFHATEAARILGEGWLAPGSGAFYKGPLFSYLLAVVGAFTGPEHSVVAARILAACCGTASVFLIARIAARLGGARAAWVAGLVAALYGPAIYFDATLLLTPWVSLLLLGAADRLVDAMEQEDPARPLAFAGLLLGLATVTRANALLLLFALATWLLFSAPRRWPEMTRVRALALLLVPALLVVAPVSARNAIVERDPVLVSWNGGINLFMGNDPAFDQGSGNWNPDFAWMRLYNAPPELGRARGSEHQRFFLAQSVRRAVAEPGTQLAVLANKSALLISGYEISNNRRIDELCAHSGVLRVLLPRLGPVHLPFVLLAPFLVVGVALGWRRHRAAAPLLLLAGTWLITPVLFFHTARFRLPALLLLLPIAAAGCIAARPNGRRWVAIAILALATLAGTIVSAPARATLPPPDLVLYGEELDGRGDAEGALAAFQRAAAVEPRNPLVRIRVGDRLRRSGRFAEALEHFDAVLALEGVARDWHLAALRSRARCLAQLRRFEEGIADYRRFLDAEPDLPYTGERPDFHLRGIPPFVACRHRIELAEVLGAAGRREEAVVELARVIEECADAEPVAVSAQRMLRKVAGER